MTMMMVIDGLSVILQLMMLDGLRVSVADDDDR
jgi:hypothetical protein